MADLALAVDIGGTKMAAGLVTSDGSLVERAMVPTRGSVTVSGAGGEVDPAQLMWGDLEGLVRGVMGAVDLGDRLVVCGAGCGGPMSPGGEHVSPLNIPAWRGFPSARVAGHADRPADVRRQRRQGSCVGRGVGGRRGRLP